MTIKRMLWKPVSVHRFVLLFLLAERDTNLAPFRNADPQLVDSLLDAPDLANSTDNQLRMRLLYLMRCRYVGEIPADTIWYEVQNLTDDDLGSLYVTRHASWTAPTDNNELLEVAKRLPAAMRSPPSSWRSIILWGHDRLGPFSIIEGNHRLVSYAASRTSLSERLRIQVLVGLSPSLCYWHPLDPPTFVMADLWK